ncbi:MAG: helix-turn-helix transcriptional regulator [Methanococcaceae archaeon]
MVELKNNLRRFRFEHNQITQDELAKKVEVSRQTILSIENGKFNPSVTLALKIANYFNCKIENIFYLEESQE